MTTVTVPVRHPAREHRPRRLRWLLRLHRPALYVWAATFTVVAGMLLLLSGPLADAAADAWKQYNACGFEPKCAYDQDAIIRYKDWYNYATLTMAAMPFAVAAWSGAALFGRELESGTAQLMWSQGVSPAHWFTARLAVPAVLLTAGTSLLFWLHRLAWDAGRGRLGSAKQWYDDPTLHANGPTTVALTLAGLAGGALAALLVRRALPALTIALGFAVVVRGVVRQALPYLWPPVTRINSLQDGYAIEGLHVDSGLVTSTGAHIADPGCGPTGNIPKCGAMYDRLDATGYYTQYHPESHYWPLQLSTTALVLVLAAAFAVIAFLLLRHTTARPGRRTGTPHGPHGPLKEITP